MKEVSTVLYIKAGKVSKRALKGTKRKELVSAIDKRPISKAFLTKTGFKEDEQADTKHHGGINKALFLFSKKTYQKINSACNTDFKIDENAHFGENIIVSDICEDDVFIGDIFKIGDAKIQITQPRQPCWKLSANTGKKEMTKFIFNSGYTGWYAKVLKEGEIVKGDAISLVKREESELSISLLNKLIRDPDIDERLTKKALKSQFLGYQFKNSLEKRFRLKEKDEQFSSYHE
jgi:MOSC domain-containing protein YiiM